MKERKKNVDRVFFFFFSLTFFSSSFLSHFFLLLALESSFQQKEADFCKIMIDLWGLIDEVTGNSEGGKEREVLRSRSVFLLGGRTNEPFSISRSLSSSLFPLPPSAP